ncbi:MAG: hypothetical protein ACK6DT_05810 [Planctomycetota bacterium]|jgi:hypothetical protein
MRWMLAGLMFALAVGLAIGTAALRAENARSRRSVEREYRAVWDRVVELKRLTIEKLAEASPERLAQAHRAHLRAELSRQEARAR